MKTPLLIAFSFFIINTGMAQTPGTISTSLASQSLLLLTDNINICGSTNNNKNILEWTFAENEISNYFEVQRSEDGIHFSTAGLVFSTGKEGNEMYAFKENKSNSNYYRLMIINNDKSYTYSRTILLKDQYTKNNNIKITSNSTISSLVVTYTATQENFSGTINVYTATGAKIFVKETAFVKGVNILNLNAENVLRAGTYFIEVINNKERSYSKFIKK